MKVIFTKNEIDVAIEFATIVAKELNTPMNDKEVYQAFKNQKFITIEVNGDITFDIPEVFLISYYKILNKNSGVLIPMGLSLYNSVLVFVKLYKGMLNDISEMFNGIMKTNGSEK